MAGRWPREYSAFPATVTLVQVPNIQVLQKLLSVEACAYNPSSVELRGGVRRVLELAGHQLQSSDGPHLSSEVESDRGPPCVHVQTTHTHTLTKLLRR